MEGEECSEVLERKCDLVHEEECKNVETEKCSTVYKNQCKKISKVMIVEPFLQSSLYFIWKETCLDIPQLMCKTDKKEECQDLHRLFCAEEPELDCHSLPRRNCTLKPTVEIKDVSNTECNTEFRTVCTKIFNQVHLVNFLNIAVFYPYLLSGLHCQ